MGKIENLFNEAYWSSRWQNGETGWDIGRAAPAIVDYFSQLTDKSVSILIPGCGNAYEAEALNEMGFTDITVLDIVAEKVAELETSLQGSHIKVLYGDFFTHQSTYDYIIEHTFFCSLPVSLRPAYAEQTSKLLHNGGHLVGLLFNRTFDGDEPPFGGDAETYQSIFSAFYRNISLAPCLQSIAPRAGKELFIIATK